jgi:hypothetical protein
MKWKISLPAHEDPMIGYTLNRIERQYGLQHSYRSFRIIPPGSDIIMTASSSAANTDITAGFDGLFADIQ